MGLIGAMIHTSAGCGADVDATPDSDLAVKLAPVFASRALTPQLASDASPTEAKDTEPWATEEAERVLESRVLIMLLSGEKNDPPWDRVAKDLYRHPVRSRTARDIQIGAAELYRRRGEYPEALTHYRMAFVHAVMESAQFMEPTDQLQEAISNETIQRAELNIDWLLRRLNRHHRARRTKN